MVCNCFNKTFLLTRFACYSPVKDNTGHQDYKCIWSVHSALKWSGEEEKQVYPADPLAGSAILADSIIFYARNWDLINLNVQSKSIIKDYEKKQETDTILYRAPLNWGS